MSFMGRCLEQVMDIANRLSFMLMDAGYSNILTGIVTIFIFLTILSSRLNAHKLERRARMLGARLAPVCAKPFGGRLYLLINIFKINHDKLFRNLEPSQSSSVYRIHMNSPYDHVVRDPEILSTTFSTFGKGSKFREAFKDNWGSAVATLELTDPKWHYLRETLRPFFTKRRLRNVKLEYTDKILGKFYENSKTNTPVDVQELFLSYGFETTLEFFTGVQSKDFKKVTGYELSDYIVAFDQALERTTIGYFLGHFRRLYQLFPGCSVKKPMQTVVSVVDQLIQHEYEKKAEVKVKDNTKFCIKEDTTLVEYLVAEMDDRKMIREQIISIFFGGKDTTGILLTSIMLHLSEHPDVYKIMREDVIRVLGHSSVPDESALKDCGGLINAVLKETLRFTTTVPMNFRWCNEDTVLEASDGKRYLFPKNCYTVLDIWAMQRDTLWWGEDAGTWDPYRWLDSRHQKVLENPHLYQPFSSGPRLCPGQSYSHQLVPLTLARICQAFKKIERAKDIQPVTFPFFSITLDWKGGIHLRMTPDPEFQF